MLGTRTGNRQLNLESSQWSCWVMSTRPFSMLARGSNVVPIPPLVDIFTTVWPPKNWSTSHVSDLSK